MANRNIKRYPVFLYSLILWLIFSCETRRAHELYLFKEQSTPEYMAKDQFAIMTNIMIRVNYPELKFSQDTKETRKQKSRYYFNILIFGQSDFQKVTIHDINIDILFLKNKIKKKLTDIRCFVDDSEGKLIQYTNMVDLPEPVRTIDPDDRIRQQFDYYIWDDPVRYNKDLDEEMILTLDINLGSAGKMMDIKKEYHLKKIYREIPATKDSSCINVLFGL
ncbi:MAG: hypothetical protein JW827_07610 [Spirochaetes bacterium]|nr:hypothetical protein [Spirochaetota bacterium]